MQIYIYIKTYVLYIHICLYVLYVTLGKYKMRLTYTFFKNPNVNIFFFLPLLLNCLLLLPQVLPSCSQFPTIHLFRAPLPCSIFTFLVSETTPGYRLTSEDLNLGNCPCKGPCGIVFLGPSY